MPNSSWEAADGHIEGARVYRSVRKQGVCHDDLRPKTPKGERATQKERLP